MRGLEEIDWAALEHNYGSAEDVPPLLRRCAGRDADAAGEAAADLTNLVFHQGGWICPAAPAVLPFLVRLAADPEGTCRRDVLDLVAMLAAEAVQVRPRFLAPAWSPAWERALPELLALLDDPEPEIRRAAAGALADCETPGAPLLPALLDRWRAEADPVTRLDLALALGKAVRREPVGDRAASVTDLLHSLLDASDPQLPLAAVHALAPGDPALPVRRLDTVLGALRDRSVSQWRRTAAVDSGVIAVGGWTAALYPGPFPPYALGLLVDHADAEQRTGALAEAGRQVAGWRSPVPALLPRITARLDDPCTEVRFRAAELLACLGSEAADHPCADALTALLDDTSRRTTRQGETVAEAAVWALARRNDPRCLPLLGEYLCGTRPGFTLSYTTSAEDWHWPVLPSPADVLIRLDEHAVHLLPALLERLGATRDAPEVTRLCAVLVAWGPVARAAEPLLLDLLTGDTTWKAAATALAAVGGTAEDVGERLLNRAQPGAPDADVAAWAYWKLRGDHEPALRVLGPAATEGRFPHPALRRLADLGPLAAAYAEPLRAMTSAAEPWTSVEAAHALWAVTGDTDHAVPALLAPVRDLASGRHRPVALPAVRYLTRMGAAARAAGPLLRAVPGSDRRLRSNGGWSGFVQDQEIRVAVNELLAVCS
ncbi:HEAT repeat domain-containing protein [Streptomyces longwoodensis]|uniref:HEAT repeat domain-containing protein n=1 Tax=Streptomyces longwoodensis TaxID=68231 RepID=UPI0036C3AAD7